MRPEAADYLQKARHCLANARTILAAGVADVAAREAYLAAFHGAEAYVFERTGKAAKTHRGLRVQFSRLARDEHRIARELQAFLGEGYGFKIIADYGIGSSIETISDADAIAAIGVATNFIATVASLLGSAD